MPEPPRNLPHLYPRPGTPEPFTSPVDGRTRAAPPRDDRAGHAAELERQLTQAIAQGRARVAERETDAEAGEAGFYLEFAITPGEREALEKLGNRPRGIELVAVRRPREGSERLTATVFVPERSAEYYLGRVEQYRTSETATGRPRHEALVARLEAARVGEVRSLFTDRSVTFPPPEREIWWEVWLRMGRRGHFDVAAGQMEIPTREHVLIFPEREVVLARATAVTLERLLGNTDAIAELRIAKDQPSVYLDMGAREQADWGGGLLDRTVPPADCAVAVCLLDSGVAREHPLLERCIHPDDVHTCNPAWGTADTGWGGHGTGMAGLSLYGDLVEVVGGNQPVAIGHCLESVKILAPGQPNDRELYGAITAEAVARAEVQAPERERVVCLPVTSDEDPPTGRPSAWSAAVDQLAYGDGETPRLIVASAGNIRGDLVPGEYLDVNDTSGIESPAQAWNALTVGACTEKVNIVEEGCEDFTPLAPAGDLCPTSRTSVAWPRQWPVKPDIVLEGGNCGIDGDQTTGLVDLSLLTTSHDFVNRGLFRSFAETSAASALAARMAAQLMTARRGTWPETVRALMVHSAEWTPAMRDRLAADPSQREKASLLRRYGYGVPSLARARWSAANDVTLVVEDEIQPFIFEHGRAKTHQMKLHRFPWPRAVLESLGDAPVEMRVTLSYFVEPNPGERGWVRRHRYASHALRFEVKGMLETDEQFRGRINRLAWEDEEREEGNLTDEDKWFFRDIRNPGSVHSDFWRASGAELAQRDAIAVHPIGGWWKEKPQLGRCDRTVRYALVVSIRAPASEIDIYTPIANSIAAGAEIVT
ncbi:MAG TPA: S8 family peptidase [Longimicrobiaceae bacterium]|nr:S8 family peptidase [Longimicrobiaceae bacterium]